MPVRPAFAAGISSALALLLLVTAAQPALADALTFDYALKLAETMAPENLARAAQVASQMPPFAPLMRYLIPSSFWASITCP